jgi:hypothetical protein
MQDATLDAAILDALRPRGARERVRKLVSGGYTAAQVCERLPDGIREDLAQGAEGAPGARRAIDGVHQALIRLVGAGRVARRRATYRVFINTKGDRAMIVDLYSLA